MVLPTLSITKWQLLVLTFIWIIYITNSFTNFSVFIVASLQNVLFTGNLAVKTRKSNTKSLQCRQRISETFTILIRTFINNYRLYRVTSYCETYSDVTNNNITSWGSAVLSSANPDLATPELLLLIGLIDFHWLFFYESGLFGN